MKEKFKQITINDEKMSVIRKANKILAGYIGKYDITLRGLYYQFVARDEFPDTWKWKKINDKKWIRDLENGTKNADPNYKMLGDIIGDGRLMGLVDWEVLGDEERFIRQLSRWNGPAHAIESITQQYRTDLWKNMSVVPEVWVEKNALIGLLEPICNRRRVGLFSCKGYASLTAFRQAAHRLQAIIDVGQEPVILHLGDHDPSGVDMTRNIREYLEMFLRKSIRVDRLALNMDQVLEFSPPPNPAKIKDPRAKKYIKQYGDESWELDALEPTQFDDVVTAAIDEFIDIDTWNENLKREKSDKAQMQKVSDKWGNVVGYINKLED